MGRIICVHYHVHPVMHQYGFWWCTRQCANTKGNMGNLTDLQIRDRIKRGEHFEQRGDGDGLILCYP